MLSLGLAKKGSPEDDDVHEGRQLLEFRSHRVGAKSKQDKHI